MDFYPNYFEDRGYKKFLKITRMFKKSDSEFLNIFSTERALSKITIPSNDKPLAS